MKKKITIGLFVDSFFPMIDGVVSVADNYAVRLGKYANVIVFAPRYDKNYDDNKIPYTVVRCKSYKLHFIDYSLSTPKLDYKFLKKLDSYNLDIVHIHSPFMMGRMGLTYAKKRGIPVIGTMHSQFRQDFYRATKNKYLSEKLNKKMVIEPFEKCTKCYAVNHEIARIYHEDYGYKEMPEVLGNATEMKPANKKEARNYINEKYHLDDNQKVLLFVGRINALKNIYFIVDALKELKKISDLDFKMLFVGSGQDEEKLKEYIIKNKLSNNIIMCGRVANRKKLSYYYQRADLFLFPSLYDASSIVQIEAASQKTPTLFIEGAATIGSIKNNIDGFISEDNYKAYALKIKEIMEDEKLYKKVSNEAYKKVYITWDKQIKNVYNEYLKVIDENS